MSILLENIKRSKNFYPRIYRGILTALFIAFMLISILLVINLYYYVNRGDTAYYATSIDGQLYPIQASEVPPSYTDFTNIVEY